MTKVMIMVKYYSVLIALLLFSSCGQTDEIGEKEKAVIVKQVEQMFTNYHDDIRKDGLTAEFKYLDSSADFFWVPPGYNSPLTYDSVKVILNANARMFRSVEFKWKSLKVFPLTYEIANYSGIVEGIMIDTAGVRSSMLIIESGTVIKRPDGWKLLSGQSAVLGTDADN